MNEAERNYEIWDREMLAVIRALSHWHHYLEGGNHFEVWTDHKNLEYWETTRDLSRRQAQWALFLSHFDFDVVYKPGKLHPPDMLSCNPAFETSDTEDNQK